MSLETCWSRLIYTKLSSHRSFVINMYVITMAWRCISPWSFHRSLQRRREMNIFHICQQVSAFWSKNNPKKREKLRLNARKHWESESRNRNLSAAVLHVKPNKSAATFKKGIFVHPPWVPNCMQNLKGGWKFSFPKIFDSYRDMFLTFRNIILSGRYQRHRCCFKETYSYQLTPAEKDKFKKVIKAIKIHLHAFDKSTSIF